MQQRDAELRKEAVDKYKKVRELFPHCEEYMYHIKLKPEKAQVINRERLENLCKRLKRRAPKESEIALVFDLDHALASITTEPLACLSIRLEHQELERQANDLRKDFQNQVNYLRAMLLESDQKYALLVEPPRADQETLTEINWHEHQKYVAMLEENQHRYHENHVEVQAEQLPEPIRKH